ncbi:hypothetical protein B0T19DRAFT_130009 [Cercophora scortea]|uniref:Calponin-homology (CH) domain-containing protein n=1 Tax=Cercophora scortea TaxID=314031 RepID=A0AAE0IYD0_9PEZI|nr:hypothetical protein B0T19DRAFT_130009 [Cercophora scortea]
MASVSSLDKDLRKMRLDKYTPAAANEVRLWIEGVLGERLPSIDVLEGLKDGVALCKLVNLAVGPPGVRFKQSAMPFVQMENISLFLRACQAPPLNLQEHDMFLTVDLYEQKDPTQVLQCLGAFSRAANAVNPSAFPAPIGPRTARSGVMSPQSTGPVTPTQTGLRGRGASNASNASSSVYGRGPALMSSKTGDSSSGRWSPTKSPSQNGSSSPVNTSSWSRKEHEGATSPAWNIAQYGYMGGASQGNLGIAFGGRRQITSAGPYVPNMADKERKRREAEAEAELQRQQMEEEQRRRKAEQEAEEERARIEEERRWEEEASRLRQEERTRIEEEKRRWEEEERQWKLAEEKRVKEEEEAEARLRAERQQIRGKSDAKLRGQFLSQYQAEQEPDNSKDGYSNRIKELEKELEQARRREAEYERERQERPRRRAADDDPSNNAKTRARSRSRPAPPARPVSRQDSWRPRDEREFLRSEWTQTQQQQQSQSQGQGQLDVTAPPPPSHSPRPLPDPTAIAAAAAAVPPPTKVKTHRTGGDGPPIIPVRKHNTGSRPLPDPAAYKATSQPQPPPQQQQHQPQPQPQPQPPQYQQQQQQQQPKPHPLQPSPQMSRTDRYQAQANNPPTQQPPPPSSSPQQTFSRELAAVDEREAEDRRRAHAQKATKAGGIASKSLLEREMEMERQRQREWEDAQKETAKAARAGDGGVDGIGGGVGGRWDVGQWAGYTGGDSQNRGGQGIGAGRRQIVGPRPLPSRPGGG